jgi:adenylate kinase family enzyme
MTQLHFEDFLSENSLHGKSDEAIVDRLIKELVNQPATRVILYEFPQNETQAKYFMKNCRNPSNVFYVKCSKDDCQERMLEIGKDSPYYMPSSILSKKIRNFNEHAEKLLPLLKSAPTKFLELDTSAQTFSHSFNQLCKAVEPTILNLISYAEGTNQHDDTFKAMLETLNTQGYKRVQVNDLIRLENQRQTDFGRVFMQSIA